MLKLCDFGLARRCSGYGKPCTPTVTSLWYRAPEILLGEKVYGTAVDIWSFGCIFAEWLQHGEPLFQGQNESSQVETIFKLLGTPSEHSWPAFPTLPGVQMQMVPLPENFTMTLGGDGALIKMPKNGLRKKFPAVGYTPAALALAQARRRVHSHPSTSRFTSLCCLCSRHRACGRDSSARPRSPRRASSWSTRASRASTPAAERSNRRPADVPCVGRHPLLTLCGPAAVRRSPEQRTSALRALEHGWFTEEPLPVPLSRSEIKQLRRNRDEAISSGAHAQQLAQQKAQANAAQAQASAAAIAEQIKQKMQAGGFGGMVHQRYLG